MPPTAGLSLPWRIPHIVVAMACTLTLTAPAVHAQDYPTKPLRMIVPAPAGSPPDTFTRWIADRLATSIGQPVVIDNKPGAGGTIGMGTLAKSAADGYTIGYVHQGHLAFNPFIYARPGYDALKDFAPITRFADSALVLAVHPDVKAATVAEFVRLARSTQNGLTFGSAPIGTPPHIAEQLFQRAAGIRSTVVPYKGGNFALIDLAAGRVHYTLDGVSATVPHAQAGKVRMLGVSSAERLPMLPHVPTIAESGLPGYSYVTWSGFVVPAGSPTEAIRRLGAVLVQIAQQPGTRDWLATSGSVPVGDTPDQFGALIREEFAKWGPVITSAGIRLE